MNPKAPERLRKCHALLRALNGVAEAAAFREPVDPVALGIPDYPAVIKAPMDFATIRTRLECAGEPGQHQQQQPQPEGAYESEHEFAEDMRLVFANARLYNPPGHPVHEAAAALAAVFEKHFARMFCCDNNTAAAAAAAIAAGNVGGDAAAAAVDNAPPKLQRVAAEVRRVLEARLAQQHKGRLAGGTNVASAGAGAGVGAGNDEERRQEDRDREGKRRAVAEWLGTLKGFAIDRAVDTLLRIAPPILRRSILTAPVSYDPVVEIDLDRLEDDTIDVLINELGISITQAQPHFLQQQQQQGVTSTSLLHTTS